MPMFSGVRRFFGAVKVEESATDITVSGIPADVIARDISKIWSTERINSYMFKTMGKNSFSFPKFFAPDVHYALSAIGNIKKSKTRHGPVRHILHLLETETWLRTITEDKPNRLDKSLLPREMNITLLPHQDKFLDIYNERVPRYNLNGYLLAADPGTGKTINGLAIAVCLKASTVIIVSPKNAIRRVWVATIRERFKNPQKVWLVDDGKPYAGEKFIIVHYEALAKALGVTGKMNKAKTVVILDESHNLNETSSGRTKNFIDLCAQSHATDVLWMSGTPLKAMGYETIPILRTIDPLFTRDVEERFKRIFGKSVGRAVDVLRNRIGLISYHVVGAAVIGNKIVNHRVKVKMRGSADYTLDAIRAEISKFVRDRLAYYNGRMKQYVRTYEDAVKAYSRTIDTSEQKAELKKYRQYIEIIRKGYDPQAHKDQAAFCNYFELKKILPSMTSKEDRDAFRDARSVVKYVKLKVVGEALGKILGKKRAQCHIDMIPHMGLEKIITDASTKTVIFTSFVSVVDGISDYLKGKGYQPLVVYGATNNDLAGIIGKFEKSVDANPLIATYQSLSTAVPLVMASSAVFVNQPYRNFEMIQARARLDRIGASTQIDFYDMVLDTGKEPNISTRALDILEWSKEQVAAMMGTDANQADINKTLNTYYNQASQEHYIDTQENAFDIAFESYLAEEFPDVSIETVLEPLGQDLEGLFQ